MPAKNAYLASGKDDVFLLAEIDRLINKMHTVSEYLSQRGNEAQSAEMAGAANILQTWKKGIQKEMIADEEPLDLTNMHPHG